MCKSVYLCCIILWFSSEIAVLKWYLSKSQLSEKFKQAENRRKFPNSEVFLILSISKQTCLKIRIVSRCKFICVIPCDCVEKLVSTVVNPEFSILTNSVLTAWLFGPQSSFYCYLLDIFGMVNITEWTRIWLKIWSQILLDE